MGYGCGMRLFSLCCLSLLVSIGCHPKDYNLLHPVQPSPGICREAEIFEWGPLRVHWIAYYPEGRDHLPAVLVHPDKDGLASDMEGTCLTLARRGYFAAAVHYQRLENLREENPLIPFKTFEEGMAGYRYLLGHPRVDPGRIGLLGFSKGGMHSLLIAAVEPTVKAVVAYYPLSDFEEWLDVSRYPFPRSLLIRGIRRHIVKDLGVSGWEEALAQLKTVSPINHVADIQAPVLLIHGEKDRKVPVRQSERLYRDLQAAGKSCELLIVPGAGHVFNFRDEEQGRMAWEKTLQFLDGQLKADVSEPSSEGRLR